MCFDIFNQNLSFVRYERVKLNLRHERIFSQNCNPSLSLLAFVESTYLFNIWYYQESESVHTNVSTLLVQFDDDRPLSSREI